MNKESRKRVELLWKEEKYKVMYYSQKKYLLIRQELNNGLDEPKVLEDIIAVTYIKVCSLDETSLDGILQSNALKLYKV
ncbi:hypothetical protein J9174_00535 [Macrococcoides canis]|uniref:hypothetical protein n=1 Tax=Macrococcoides canis TaxID=1855823 RepID=UPI001AEBD011|nr:hypothetical protein [Macrococcus canis]QTQ08205.1 hypothetical protein J9174_00535 [Macrococcus canis]